MSSPPESIRRALITSAIVGSALVAFNQYDTILAGELDTKLAVKIVLTYLTPFAVSLSSSILAARELGRGR